LEKRSKNFKTHFQGGCVRFDQSSLIEVVFSPDTMCYWTSEILKFTVSKKDVNIPEVCFVV